jgi:hypothetical protein
MGRLRHGAGTVHTHGLLHVDLLDRRRPARQPLCRRHARGPGREVHDRRRLPREHGWVHRAEQRGRRRAEQPDRHRPRRSPAIYPVRRPDRTGRRLDLHAHTRSGRPSLLPGGLRQGGARGVVRGRGTQPEPLRRADLPTAVRRRSRRAGQLLVLVLRDGFRPGRPVGRSLDDPHAGGLWGGWRVPGSVSRFRDDQRAGRGARRASLCGHAHQRDPLRRRRPAVRHRASAGKGRPAIPACPTDLELSPAAQGGARLPSHRAGRGHDQADPPGQAPARTGPPRAGGHLRRHPGVRHGWRRDQVRRPLLAQAPAAGSVRDLDSRPGPGRAALGPGHRPHPNHPPTGQCGTRRVREARLPA